MLGYRTIVYYRGSTPRLVIITRPPGLREKEKSMQKVIEKRIWWKSFKRGVFLKWKSKIILVFVKE
jgi:hypothetical protein